MKQLTIRGVDDKLHHALRSRAEQEGLSVNRYVLALLKESLGLASGRALEDVEYDDLDHLIGSWTQEAYEEFSDLLQDQRQIDPELWP
jgi:plasmid stability protein